MLFTSIHIYHKNNISIEVVATCWTYFTVVKLNNSLATSKLCADNKKIGEAGGKSISINHSKIYRKKEYAVVKDKIYININVRSLL
jgi:hypothetical protein